MPVTATLADELETLTRVFTLAPGLQLDTDDTDLPEVTVTWQRWKGHPATCTVTAPTGETGWHQPVPHRPPWLVKIINDNGPRWWKP